MDELKIKLAELAKAFAEFKTLNEDRLKAVEAKGFAPADKLEQLEKANAKIDSLELEIKRIETAMNRSGRGGSNEGEKDEKKEAYKKAFNSFLRKGQETELKTMSVDSDEDGGYLVTDQVSSEIMTKVFESSPMRQLASAQTISSDTLDILEDLDEVASGWVGETGARPNTATAKLNMLKIAVHEIFAFPLATQKFLDDASINVESWLAGKVAAKFSRDEATAFISGNGVAKPKGILDYTSGTGYGQIEQVASGHASQLTGDAFMNLCYSIKEDYKNGASWLMNRLTVKEARKLKDLQGQYLWAPGLNGSTQSTLMGYPIGEAADMPLVGANLLAVAFGNFKIGYQIVDRIGIRTLRDPYTQKPFVGFYSTKRVGGAVKNFEAIKLMKIMV
jgi:HK97 family phage major capsid protein